MERFEIIRKIENILSEVTMNILNENNDLSLTVLKRDVHSSYYDNVHCKYVHDGSTKIIYFVGF